MAESFDAYNYVLGRMELVYPLTQLQCLIRLNNNWAQRTMDYNMLDAGRLTTSQALRSLSHQEILRHGNCTDLYELLLSLHGTPFAETKTYADFISKLAPFVKLPVSPKRVFEDEEQ